ncbi:MAG: endonuclease I family protein [Chitinophagales bacterium]
MKYSTLLFLFLLSANVFAQEIIESCKYGQPLIEAIQDAYTPSNSLGYGPGRDILYSEIDNNGLELSGIYSNFTVTLDPNADPSVSAYQGGSGINAEHVYPQSMGAGEEPAKSDLHNIFPSRVDVNSARGSCPFGEVEDNDTDKWFYLNTVLSSIPSSNIDSYSEKDEEDCVFEPREEVKGNIARAVFYFYAIYQDIADSKSSSFFPLQKEVLYQWHLTDPVDETEKLRDGLIAAEQGNHNPFIVDSSLVFRAYFSEDAVYSDVDPNCYPIVTSIEGQNVANWASISTNFVQNELLISSTKNETQVFLFDLYGRLVLEREMRNESQLELGSLSQGFIFCSFNRKVKRSLLGF